MIGVAQHGSPAALAAMLSEAEDRKFIAATSGTISASPTYEISRTIDASDGVNYSGGSSYVPGLPLLPSNAGLVGYHGTVREASFGAMTYEEAMNYSPAPMTQRISALKAGAGRTLEGPGDSEGVSMLWIYLAMAGAAWLLFFRKPPAETDFF